MRCFSYLVCFLLGLEFVLVHAFSDSIFSEQDFDTSSLGIAQGGLDLFETFPENLDWNSMSAGFQPFDLDDDFINSDANIDWDPNPFLADAMSSDLCVSQADIFSLEARDAGALCSPSQKEEVILSPQTTQLFEDPLGNLETDLLPFKGQIDEEEKPRYPGLLTEEQLRERERLEGELWFIHHPPEDTDDPCAPYRSRGYEINVCCEQPYDTYNNIEMWYRSLALQGCHQSTLRVSSPVVELELQLHHEMLIFCSFFPDIIKLMLASVLQY